MESRIIRIKPSALVTKDGSQKTKQYEFQGNRYILCGQQTKAVPALIANQWVAGDSEVEILNVR